MAKVPPAPPGVSTVEFGQRIMKEMTPLINHIEATTAQVRVTNTAAESVIFWLEPCGNEYQLDPNASADVVFQSAQAGVPEVQHEDDRISVWGWTRASARVFIEGVEVDETAAS
mgnify:CR=1 FL=1